MPPVSHTDVLPGSRFISAASLYCKDGQSRVLVTGGYDASFVENYTTIRFNVDDLTHDVMPDRPQALMPQDTSDSMATCANCDVFTTDAYLENSDFGPPNFDQHYSACWRFVRASETWAAMPDLPYSDNAGHMLCMGMPNGSILAAIPSGDAHGMLDPSKKYCYRWDPSDNLWHGLDFPLSDGPDHAIPTSIGGCILSDGRYLAVGGGRGTSPFGTNVLRWSIFDGTSWSAVTVETPYAIPAGYLGASTVSSFVMPLAGGKALHLLTYFKSTSFLPHDSDVVITQFAWEFDGVSTWTSTAVPSTPRMLYGTAGSFSDEAFVVGGIGVGGTNLDSIERYDAGTGTWSAYGNLANPSYYVTTIIAPNGAGPGRLYCIGGWDGGTGYYDDVLILDVLPTTAAGSCSCSPTPPTTDGVPVADNDGLSELGEDIDVLDDLRPSFVMCSGFQNLGNAICRRLSTPAGSLADIGDDPDYGYDLRGRLNSESTLDEIAKIGPEVEQEVMKDERVQAADIVSTYSLANSALAVEINVLTKTGQTFRLILGVGTVTVDLIDIVAAA